MAYVDHAFSISDEEDLVGGAVGSLRGVPVKEIAFAAALLAFGTVGAVAGLVMAANRVGGDRAHGIFFMILGIVKFIPGSTTQESPIMLTEGTGLGPRQ